MVILAPIAAMLVQMAISRTREYSADAMGAQISGRPLALASALARIENAAHQIENPVAEQHPATAHLFIINPLSGARMDNLFGTHPATENRIAALQDIAARMGQSGARPSPSHVRPARGATPGVDHGDDAHSRHRAEPGPPSTPSDDGPCPYKLNRPGLPARRVAADLLDGVLRRRRALDELLDRRQTPSRTSARLPSATVRLRARSSARRCAGLARCATCSTNISTTACRGQPRALRRRCSSARHSSCFSTCRTTRRSISPSGLPSPDRRPRVTSELVNAVLRRIARSGADMLAEADGVALDTPTWLMARWSRHYGTETARAIALANGIEPPLDLTVKADPQGWATRLGGDAAADRFAAPHPERTGFAACRL